MSIVVVRTVECDGKDCLSSTDADKWEDGGPWISFKINVMYGNKGIIYLCPSCSDKIDWGEKM